MRSSPWAVLWVVVLVACRGAEDPGSGTERLEPAVYVGTEACSRCHSAEAELWRGSHHDLAMQEATEESVLGSFDDVTFEHEGIVTTFRRRDGGFWVSTEGPEGATGEFEVAYTFGVDPLQQYLLELPDGRFQAFTVAWDSRREAGGGQRWFHLYPGERITASDPLHWTGRLHNWNLMCAECHSTDLEKGFDLETNRYHTEWAEIDVSCEACHGPGSRHVEWPEQTPRLAGNGLAVDLSDRDGAIWVMDMVTGLSKRAPLRTSRVEVEVCARCHARRSPQLGEYRHGKPFLDTHRPALLTEPLYFADGQPEDEVYVYGSFLQSKMYREGVTCKDCHDPHALALRGEGNSVCGACHLAERFDSASHHHHEPGSPGASCVECHMPARTYMVVDPRRDHSFRVPRPDLSLEIGTPNACNGCHRDRDAAWARKAIVQWYGEEVSPHFGVAFAAARSGAPGTGRDLERVIQSEESPAIARATALSMLAANPTSGTSEVLRGALSDPDPLVRFGALQSAELLPPAVRHQSVVPLLRDPLRTLRVEAARALWSVPREIFTTEQIAALDEALAEYRDAQLRNADWPESHMNLGTLHQARGEHPEAREAYETALRLDPDFSRAYVNLADLLRVEGRDAEGEGLLRRALERLPRDPALHHALGLLFVRMKRLGEALPELARAAELDPEEPRYSYVQGVALQSTGDPNGALRTLTSAIERHPHDRDLLVALATLHRDRGDRSEAIVYAKRLIEVAPDDPGARELLAELTGSR